MKDLATTPRGLLLAALFFFSFSSLPALALPPTDAEVVFVRKDCTSFVDPGICVETITDINAWIPTRLPAHNPVLIDVGPGDWDPFLCNGQNAISIRGAGRETTRLLRLDDAQRGGMDFRDCDGIDVESLTAKGPFAGVTWFRAGRSTWSDVDILGGGTEIPTGALGNFFSFGWYDNGQQCGGAVHYFFGSRIAALGNAVINVGYNVKCSETWIFGGELMATHEADFGGGVNQSALLTSNALSNIRVFGSAIRSQVGDALNTPVFGFTQAEMTGVEVPTGQFHMHGGIVSVTAKGSTQSVGALGLLTSSNTAQAHTPGTAFIVASASGAASTRVRGPQGVTQSPFLWQQGDEPPRSIPGDPTSAFVGSIQGADLFVETDCSASSCTGGSDPHLLVYSENCAGASGPWFDTVTGACRN